MIGAAAMAVHGVSRSLLKLYAGGPQDAWDIQQLLAAPEGQALTAQVDAAVRALPPDSRTLWARIRDAERG